jgi:UDP-N-acetylglucosamine 2-epimerase
MKIVTILSVLPQFVKAAALSGAIKKYPALHKVIVHTRQYPD